MGLVLSNDFLGWSTSSRATRLYSCNDGYYFHDNVVEERVSEIIAATEDAVTSLRNNLRTKLVRLPKSVRVTLCILCIAPSHSHVYIFHV